MKYVLKYLKLIQYNQMRNIISPLKIKAFIIIFCLIAAAPGITYASGQKLKVIASIVPLADFARQVGGNRVDVILMLPPGSSPHTYEPTPKTIQEISGASIFIKIGAGLEFWTDRIINAVNPDIKVVECSEGIDLIKLDTRNRTTGGHGAVDPHIWLDPLNSVKIIEKIRAAFSASDPGNSSFYKKNATGYIRKLKELDSEIAGRIATFRTKKYVTFHPAWNYFARRYGLEIAGVIKEGAGHEPTPKHLGRILLELKKMRNPVIFAEPQFSPKTAEAIAREAGGKVLFLDPIGGQEGRETYIDIMRYNLSVLESAMK